MKYLLIIVLLLFTSVSWSQEYGEQQKFIEEGGQRDGVSRIEVSVSLSKVGLKLHPSHCPYRGGGAA